MLRLIRRASLTLLASVLSLAVFLAPQAARADGTPPPPPLVKGCVSVPVTIQANVTTNLSVVVGGVVNASSTTTGTVAVNTTETAKICVTLDTLALVTVKGVALVDNGVNVTLHVQALLAPTTLKVKVTLTGPVSGSLVAKVHVKALAAADVVVCL